MISHFILNLRLCHSLGHDIGAECALFSSSNIINIHTFFINNVLFFFVCLLSTDVCMGKELEGIGDDCLI